MAKGDESFQEFNRSRDMLERLVPLKAEAERQASKDVIKNVLVQRINVIMMMLEGGVNVGPTMQTQVARIEALLREPPPESNHT